MKIANFCKLLLLAFALSLTVTACKKTPKSPTPIFGPVRGAPTGSVPSGPETAGPAIPTGPETNVRPLPANPEGVTPLSERPGDLSNYFQDRETFKQDTVYFDFDKYNVRPSELDKIQAVANFLKGQSSNAVLVEGHCDERGTPEYNRALGERRALSIRESLINLGVNADRIHTLSFGEDKPADPSHNESAWAKNRRGEFVLLKPKTGGAASELR